MLMFTDSHMMKAEENDQLVLAALAASPDSLHMNPGVRSTGGGVRGRQAAKNFGLVLGCIDADFCK